MDHPRTYVFSYVHITFAAVTFTFMTLVYELDIGIQSILCSWTNCFNLTYVVNHNLTPSDSPIGNVYIVATTLSTDPGSLCSYFHTVNANKYLNYGRETSRAR